MNSIQVLNALAAGSLLTLLASGLALIYGLRNVMNFAHGAIYMFAAFMTARLVEHTNYWVAFVVVPLTCAVLGLVLEFGLLRPFADRSVITIALVTFGLALVLSSATHSLFGTQPRVVSAPAPLDGTLDILGDPYPVYRLFLITVGLGSVALLVAWLKFTRSGLHVRAVSAQPDTARMAGVNTKRLGVIIVCLSTGFAGLAGVLAAPYLSIDTGMGDAILIISLVIVVLGGIGSIGGAIVSALIVGGLQTLGSVTAPAVTTIAPYVLLIIVLLWRPQGLGRGRVDH
ncbi:branched-chain amino acid ABC transporter permease [Nocardioides sp. 1609]|uniref:branched-chain amino acid ABC transporter permease n=1 Tax=Nocardioides sp. 1609 TaxID=2508327 RepID=UPI0014311209|nr:branched-chain amino acid ABC transporter permease [Nocardioides sp. 1609]